MTGAGPGVGGADDEKTGATNEQRQSVATIDYVLIHFRRERSQRIAPLVVRLAALLTYLSNCTSRYRKHTVWRADSAPPRLEEPPLCLRASLRRRALETSSSQSRLDL